MRELVDDFLSYLKYEKNRPDTTVSSYGDDLFMFLGYLEDIDSSFSWERVDADIVRDWMMSQTERGNSASSVNRRLSSLRSFYKFARSRGKVSCDPVHLIKGPKKEKPLPQYLRESEMDQLLQLMSEDAGFINVRNRTIVLVFYSTGVRVSELVGLDDESIDFAQWQLKVLGKRNKERVIPFSTELYEALKHYMQVRDREVPRNSKALFVSAGGLRMTREQVQAEVRKALSRATSLKKKSPHVLRHTFATSMLNNSADLQTVQKLLGHESLATTEIYTHTTFDQLKRSYLNAHPRGETQKDANRK